MREQSATLTPTLSLVEGEGAIPIPSPPEGEKPGEGVRRKMSASIRAASRAMEIFDGGKLRAADRCPSV